MAITLKEIESKLIDYLQLNGRVAAVKLYEHVEAFQECSFETVKGGLYYCYMVKLAFRGRLLKATSTEFACETAAKVIGLEAYYSEPEGAKGWEAIHVYESANLSAEKNDYLKPNRKIESVAVGPLGDFLEKPDVILIEANPMQAMRLLQGYHYFSGQSKNISASGMCGVCFESTMLPIRNADLNISMLCSGTRFVCKWKEASLMIAFPIDLLEKIMDGIIATANPCELDSRKAMINKSDSLKGSEKLELGKGYYNKCSNMEDRGSCAWHILKR